jgi:adenylate kinase family enzyme
MQRVAVVGSGGAGKTTFSRQLGEALGLPVIHLDHHFWKPGWTETPKDEWRRAQAEMVTDDRWVIDGNYGGTLEVRFPRADTIVVLDYPRVTCLGRALRRSLLGFGRDTQAPGCPERVDLGFYRWIWDYPTQGRARMTAKLREHGTHADWVWLTSPAQARRWLSAVERRANGL